MKTIETGGPAFPMQEPQAIHAYAIAAVDGITDSEVRDRAYIKASAEAVGGATLRDYFAAKAMQAWLSGHVAHYGLGDVLLDVGGRPLLGVPADLANHDDRLGVRIRLECR